MTTLVKKFPSQDNGVAFVFQGSYFLAAPWPVRSPRKALACYEKAVLASIRKSLDRRRCCPDMFRLSADAFCPYSYSSSSAFFSPCCGVATLVLLESVRVGITEIYGTYTSKATDKSRAGVPQARYAINRNRLVPLVHGGVRKMLPF